MSFSTEQKCEIIRQAPKQLCCRRSILEGILASHSALGSEEIEISLDSTDTAEFVSALIGEIYTKSPVISTSHKGGRRRIVLFSSTSAARYLRSQRENGISYSEKCSGCLGAFLRGVFLASGRVSDPAKQYSLEFSLGDMTERFSSFFKAYGLTPRISYKPNETVIYFRNSTEIEDFFALAGMNHTAFALMNEKIQSEIRNNVNRIANCETNNIDKAVSASMSQISLIEELIKKGLISYLPDELELTARARMEHKDLSLSQLAAIITPPISKPGLSHRLKKITAIAEELLKKQ